MKEFNIGEIISVNPKTRTAIVFDQTNNRSIEVPLLPECRDDDTLFNTAEHMPKAGTLVRLGYYNNDVVIQGPAPVNTYHREIDNVKLVRKHTNVNRGNPLLSGVVTDDLSLQDGYDPYNGDFFGALDPLYRKEQGQRFNFSGCSFDDIMSGDKIMATIDGNVISVLEGGVNVFKASDLCQIIGIKYNDLMRVVSRNFEHFTDFGNITIKNEDGITDFIIEGAPSQKETLSGQYRVRLQMGNLGDLFKVSILDGSGGTVSCFHMKADGEIYQYGTKFTREIVGESKEIIHGLQKFYFQGKYYQEFKDEYGKKIKGSEERTILNNQTISVQQDRTVSTSRNLTESIGGTKTENIFGSLTFGNAIKQTIALGNKTEEITTQGNFIRSTLSGDFERSTANGSFSDTTTLGNFTRSTSVGDITDDTTLGSYLLSAGAPGFYNTITLKKAGGIEIKDSFGSTVEMGSSGIKIKEFTGATLNLSTTKVALGTAAAEVVELFDQTLQQLDAFMTQYVSHIHGTVVGPTTPATNAPAVTAIQGLVATIKSLVVSIKGAV